MGRDIEKVAVASVASYLAFCSFDIFDRGSFWGKMSPE